VGITDFEFVSLFIEKATMSRKIVFITFPIILLIGVYFVGPAPDAPKWDKQMPVVPQDAEELEDFVAAREAKHKLKPDNQARIVWLDSTRKKTPYSIVYLHGFSASQAEGDPVHLQFAITFDCNLYLSRLTDHGIDTVDQLLYYTVDREWESAKEALAIGKAIGEKVILMGTSTGSTLALALAAQYPDDVFALINLSPNITINDKNAWLLNNPWGLQIARLVIGGNSRSFPKDSLKDLYWNNPYRMEATTQLQEMLESKMNKETFSKVKCPSLTLYYYKNEQEQDKTVEVKTILEMNKELGTPESEKVAVAIPGAGHHVIGSYIISKDVESVEREIRKFAIEKLKMTPVVNE
jgi:pimeloyl-ACP methyl ester carboxylesterase